MIAEKSALGETDVSDGDRAKETPTCCLCSVDLKAVTQRILAAVEKFTPESTVSVNAILKSHVFRHFACTDNTEKKSSSKTTSFYTQTQVTA